MGARGLLPFNAFLLGSKAPRGGAGRGAGSAPCRRAGVAPRGWAGPGRAAPDRAEPAAVGPACSVRGASAASDLGCCCVGWSVSGLVGVVLKDVFKTPGPTAASRGVWCLIFLFLELCPQSCHRHQQQLDSRPTEGCGRTRFPFLARGQAPKWGNVEVAHLLCVSRSFLQDLWVEALIFGDTVTKHRFLWFSGALQLFGWSELDTQTRWLQLLLWRVD